MPRGVARTVMRMLPRSWQWGEEKLSAWSCHPPPSPPFRHPEGHTWTPVSGELTAKQGAGSPRPRAEHRAPSPALTRMPGCPGSSSSNLRCAASSPRFRGLYPFLPSPCPLLRSLLRRHGLVYLLSWFNPSSQPSSAFPPNPALVSSLLVSGCSKSMLVPISTCSTLCFTPTHHASDSLLSQIPAPCLLAVPPQHAYSRPLPAHRPCPRQAPRLRQPQGSSRSRWLSDASETPEALSREQKPLPSCG